MLHRVLKQASTFKPDQHQDIPMIAVGNAIIAMLPEWEMNGSKNQVIETIVTYLRRHKVQHIMKVGLLRSVIRE